MIALMLICLPSYSQEELDDMDMSEEMEAIDSDEDEGLTSYIGHYRLGDGINLISPNGGNLNISGLVQATANVRKYKDVNKTYNRFRIRRARLRFNGIALHGKLRYRLALDMVKGSETETEGAGSMLHDAFVGYRPWGDNRLQISFGQRSTPTDNIELTMASHTLSFVERSKITSVFSTIREIGLFVDASRKLSFLPGVIRPSIAITDGDGPVSGKKRYEGLKYGARINYLPFGTFRRYGQSREGDMAYEFTPKLCVGVAYSYATGVSDRRGGRSSGDILYMNDKKRYELPDVGKFVADINFKYCGFSALAEFAKTWGYVPNEITARVRNDGSTATDFKVEGLKGDHPEEYIKAKMLLGWGVNVQMGYMFRNLWSIDARYTHIGADKYSFLNNDLYYNRPDYADVGITKYLTRNYASKIQLTVGWTRPKGEGRTPDGRNHSGNEWSADLMYQLKF